MSNLGLNVTKNFLTLLSYILFGNHLEDSDSVGGEGGVGKIKNLTETEDSGESIHPN